MEELLNNLIEKGWKPRWEDVKVLNTGVNTFNERVVRFKTNKGGFKSWWWTYRELVSKESGLWQFVCENHLYIYKMGENKNLIQDHFKNEYNECCYQYLYDKSCYEYYLLESALKDESEIEEFLLSNIKVKW